LGAQTKEKKIDSIVQFVCQNPESTVSRRISREVFGEAPEKIRLEHILTLRNELEIADELILDGYSKLVQ
jgi:hypothetical protein